MMSGFDWWREGGWRGIGGRDGLVQPRPADLVQDNEQRTLTNRKQWG